MSLKAGRVGIHPADVDPINGHLNPSTVDSYTKVQADDKFLSKSDAASTYETKSEADVLQGLIDEKMSYADNGVLGAKNLLAIPSSVVTRTINGVTFTITRNSGGQVTEIDAHDQASSTAVFDLGTVKVPKGSYIVTGCPIDGGSSSYRINVSKWDGVTETGLGQDNGDGFLFTLTEETELMIYPRIAKDYNCNHIKFYPMLRLASDPDRTFKPYTMTNKELTEKVQDIINAANNAVDFSAFKTAMGNII